MEVLLVIGTLACAVLFAYFVVSVIVSYNPPKKVEEKKPVKACSVDLSAKSKKVATYKPGDKIPEGFTPAIGADGKVDPFMTLILNTVIQNGDMVVGNVDEDGTLTIESVGKED